MPNCPKRLSVLLCGWYFNFPGDTYTFPVALDAPFTGVVYEKPSYFRTRAEVTGSFITLFQASWPLLAFCASVSLLGCLFLSLASG